MGCVSYIFVFLARCVFYTCRICYIFGIFLTLSFFDFSLVSHLIYLILSVLFSVCREFLILYIILLWGVLVIFLSFSHGVFSIHAAYAIFLVYFSLSLFSISLSFLS